MLLSVIIVTKNPGADLLATLASLSDLNTPETEIIIKDNSDNNDLETINRKFGYQNVRYIHSEDSGIYDAMNQAIELAKGEYLYFLNAGDQHIPCGLPETLKSADRQYGYIYGNVINLLPFVRVIRYTRFMNKYTLYLKRICHQGIVFKRSVFENLGTFNTGLTVNADYLFTLKMAQHYRGLKLNRFISIYKGDGFSRTYKMTNTETAEVKSSLKDIFYTPEIILLNFLALFVQVAVFLKNRNKDR